MSGLNFLGALVSKIPGFRKSEPEIQTVVAHAPPKDQFDKLDVHAKNATERLNQRLQDLKALRAACQGESATLKATLEDALSRTTELERNIADRHDEVNRLAGVLRGATVPGGSTASSAPDGTRAALGVQATALVQEYKTVIKAFDKLTKQLEAEKLTTTALAGSATLAEERQSVRWAKTVLLAIATILAALIAVTLLPPVALVGCAATLGLYCYFELRPQPGSEEEEPAARFFRRQPELRNATMTLAETLRSFRADCDDPLQTHRLLQGHLDIAGSELDRREQFKEAVVAQAEENVPRLMYDGQPFLSPCTLDPKSPDFKTTVMQVANRKLHDLSRDAAVQAAIRCAYSGAARDAIIATLAVTLGDDVLPRRFLPCETFEVDLKKSTVSADTFTGVIRLQLTLKDQIWGTATPAKKGGESVEARAAFILDRNGLTVTGLEIREQWYGKTTVRNFDFKPFLAAASAAAPGPTAPTPPTDPAAALPGPAASSPEPDSDVAAPSRPRPGAAHGRSMSWPTPSPSARRPAPNDA